MRPVLVTGANGFVGRALCCALRDQGTKIVATVRTQRGPDEVAVGNIDAATDWRPLLAGVDTVVHLAARAHLLRDDAIDKLAAFRAVNVDATMALAQQAAASGVRRFVFISSIGVNGAVTEGEPFSEASTPRPHSDYAISKLEAEERLKALCAKTGMEYVIVRPPLVYGAAAPGNFRTLLGLVHKGLPIPLGAVRNQRSMVALENLVDFIMACIEAPKAANELFFVADSSDVSTPELLRWLIEGMGGRGRVVPVPVSLLSLGARVLGKQNVFKQLCCSLQIDTAKARALLGWHAPVAIDQGLRRSAHEFTKGWNEKTV